MFMANAIILSAGQGRRLLPLTEKRPKCLLPVAGRTVLEWQVQALLAAGLERLFVVAGFNVAMVEALLDERFRRERDRIEVVFNPFYEVSDNLASCWMARRAMDDDFILLNGDTLFEPLLLDTVLGSPTAPVTLANDYKDEYDSDDMRVRLRGSLVAAVSKTLADDETQAESIGMLYFRDEGPALFRDLLQQQMRQGDGLKSWFLSAVDLMARQGLVHSCNVNGHRWCEIDFKEDLDQAHAVVSPRRRKAHRDAADAAAAEAGAVDAGTVGGILAVD